MSTAHNAYNAGIMQKTGKAFADEFFAEENQVVHRVERGRARFDEERRDRRHR